MDIMELGAIGELLGGVAVLVTLIYLATQIRQGNTLATVETELRNSANAARFSAMIAGDPMISELYHRGLRSPDPLDPLEQDRFNMLMGSLFYNFEGVFL